jgi:hypothetical protein
MAGVPATVIAFLARHSSAEFCSRCTALGVHLGAPEVRTALFELAKHIVIKMQVNTCSACRRQMVTYRFDTGEAAVPDGLLAKLLMARGGSGVCQTCLAKDLRLTVRDVQKAFWGLRVTDRARLTTGHCGVCEKLRMLLWVS